MATEQSNKKKSKKIVSDGIAHIHATFNNTIVMITEVEIRLSVASMRRA